MQMSPGGAVLLFRGGNHRFQDQGSYHKKVSFQQEYIALLKKPWSGIGPALCLWRKRVPPLRGLRVKLTSVPGFRCAPLLQLTLQDRLWAELWARLRRLIYRSANMLQGPKVK